jgi:hypothetical protein
VALITGRFYTCEGIGKIDDAVTGKHMNLVLAVVVGQTYHAQAFYR